jgi:triosephosphate isomerase
VGHSERRQYFSETNATCFKKLKSLLEQGFNCMLCVGETLSERESGQTFKVIETQLSESLGGKALSTYLDGRLEIAYEPVWAIGTGKTASPAQAEEVHAFIRQFLSSHLSADAASVTPLLYGGSVTPDNFSELLGCPNIDGGLVGGSSLKSESFLKLVEIALTTH